MKEIFKKLIPLSLLIAVFNVLLLLQLLAVAWCVWLGASGSAGLAVVLITLSVPLFAATGTGAVVGYKKIINLAKRR